MAGGIQIASLFASIGADTSGLQKGLGSAKASLNSFGTDMAKQVLGAVTLTAALATAGKFVQSSVTDWANYADSMRLSADMAGITTEEMSRLAQAADDFRVPIGTMQRSMELALKNGFVPTISSIADLSDQLMGMEDPAERAAAASKIFGKSYADIMPFLMAGGDAIRKGTAAISDNLIVTAKAAAEAKAYKDQVDALGDSWTGLKNEAGKALVPALTMVAESFTTILSGGENLIETNVDLTGSYDNYLRSVAAVNAEMKIQRDEVGKTDAVAALFMKNVKAMTEEEYNASIAMDQTAESMIAQSIAFAQNSQAIESVNEAWDKTFESINNITSLSSNFSSIISFAKSYDEGMAKIAENNEKLAGLNWWQVAYTEADEEILADNEKILASFDKLANQMTLDMLQATIAVGGITAKESELYFDMAVDMGIISTEAATAAQEAYSTAFDTINGLQIDEKTGNIVIDAEEAYATILMLNQMQIADKHGNIDLFVKYHDDGGYSWADNNYDGTRANGGPVSAGNTYLVGENGPEPFVPETNGYIIPNGQTAGMMGDNSALLSAISNLPTAKDIARAVRDAVLMVAG